MVSKFKTFQEIEISKKTKLKNIQDKIHNLFHTLRDPTKLPHQEIAYSLKKIVNIRTMYYFLLELLFLIKNTVLIFGIFLYSPLIIFIPLFKVKFLRIKLFQIGDLQYLDIIIREYFLKNKNYKFIIYSNDYVPNKPLLNLFKNHIMPFENIFLKMIFLPFFYLPFVSDDVARFDSGLNKTLSKVWNNSVKKNYPFLKYEMNKSKEEALLHNLGIKKNQKFCLLHVRTPFFCDNIPDRSLRNAKIDTYIDSIKYIIDQGYIIIRAGIYEENEKLENKINGYIDYGLSSYKSSENDCFLLSKCEFVMGTNSGLSVMGQSFNKTWVYSNANSPHMCLGLNQNDLCIFKKVFKDNREIYFDEYFKPPLGRADMNHKVAEEYNLKFQDNTSSEILDLTKEYFSNLRGKTDSSDKIQQYCKNFLKEDIHFVWGCKGKYATSFLEKRQYR
jgi:putative glycosyltransferase (TIGR04372 family)